MGKKKSVSDFEDGTDLTCLAEISRENIIVNLN